jgi:hypothetical protein
MKLYVSRNALYEEIQGLLVILDLQTAVLQLCRNALIS